MVNVKAFIDSYTDYIFNSLKNDCGDFCSQPQPLQMIPCTKCGCYFAPSWANTPPHDVCRYCKGGEKDGVS